MLSFGKLNNASAVALQTLFCAPLNLSWHRCHLGGIQREGGWGVLAACKAVKVHHHFKFGHILASYHFSQNEVLICH